MLPGFFKGAAVVALCWPAAALLAESRAISGQVVDRSGDPIPRAMIELRCEQTDEPTQFTTDAYGRFDLPLPAGAACRLVATPPGGGDPSIERDIGAEQGGSVELRLELDLFAARIDVRESALRDAVGSREIRESLARDAGEALASLAGVERVRKGGLGQDVVLRGFKGESVAVAIDGEPIHGACPNRMDPPAFHVDFAEIERIEVNRGPFDVDSGGIAGGIDILTRRPDPGLTYVLAATVGASDYLAPSASIAYGAGRWHLRGGLSARRGDAYEDGSGRSITDLLPASEPAAYRPESRDDRAFDVRTGWLGVGWTPRPGHQVELAATRQEADAQLYPYLSMDARFDDATRARASWRHQSTASWLESAEASLAWARVDHLMDDGRRVSSSSAPRDWAMATDADSRDLGARARLVLRRGWTVGVDLHRREWSATTWLAGRAYQPQASLPDARLDTLALHAARSLPIASDLAFEIGGRIEWAASRAATSLADTALYEAFHATRSTAADDLSLGGMLGLVWTPDGPWTLSARLGSAARAPDPQERYFALRRMGSDWVGNPSLAPMRNTQLDLGAGFHAERLAIDVNLWASRLDGSITLVDATRRNEVAGVRNQHARTYVNHDARLWGAEATALWRLGDEVLVTATVAATRGTRDLAPEIGVMDRDAPELPPATGRLALRWQPARWWLEAAVAAATRQRHVDSGLLEAPTPGWSVADLRGGFEIGRVGVIAGIGNLFDRTYREHLSYMRDPFRAGVVVPEPGRSLTLAVRIGADR